MRARSWLARVGPSLLPHRSFTNTWRREMELM